jgi:hypothetical protein
MKPRPQGPPKPTRLTIVLADWCPHCVPLSERNVHRLARRWKIPVQRLNIDSPAEAKLADRYVRRFGDWCADYLIPQVFLEWSDGQVNHLLTGFPEGVPFTRKAWKNLLSRPLRDFRGDDR